MSSTAMSIIRILLTFRFNTFLSLHFLLILLHEEKMLGYQFFGEVPFHSLVLGNLKRMYL